jgi:hypothetical protein
MTVRSFETDTWALDEPALAYGNRCLTALEVRTIVERNTVACVRYQSSDTVARTCRVQYSAISDSLYIPAWTSIDSWDETRRLDLECDVSEVEGRACWRYVWLRGHSTLLYPTGDAVERTAWREAAAVLRRAFPAMPPVDQLAVANFGIVRLDVRSWAGAIVVCE